MSIADQLTRIQTLRNQLRAKLVALGLTGSSATLETCVKAVVSINKAGSVSAQVRPGEIYSIPAGLHDGTGTVAGLGGDTVEVNLQTKAVTPTKAAQSVTPDIGYTGLSSVRVEAIPDTYQDVSGVTAGAEHVLAGKVFVASNGNTTTGVMPNNPDYAKTLDASTNNQVYTIPRGFHSGSGTVQVTLEEKSVTPTKSQQIITPAAGKLLNRVTVAAIPASYVQTTDADAAAANILSGKTAYVAGSKVVGTMADNGAVGGTISGLIDTTFTIPAGYTTGGTISLTMDIEQALAAL